MGQWSEKCEAKVKSVPGPSGWTGGLSLALVSREVT